MFATQRSIVYKVSNMLLSREMLILSNRRFNGSFRSACISRLVGISSGELRRKDSSTLEEGIDWSVSCPLKSSMFPRVFSRRFKYSRNRYWMKLSYRFYLISFTETFRVLSSFHFLAFWIQLFQNISLFLVYWQFDNSLILNITQWRWGKRSRDPAVTTVSTLSLRMLFLFEVPWVTIRRWHRAVRRPVLQAP